MRLRILALVGLFSLFPVSSACGSGGEEPQSVVPALTGRIVLDGVPPQPGLIVSVAGPNGATTLTDGAGTYSFPTLAPGRYAISATVPSTRETTLATVADVVAGEPAVARDMHFTALGDLRGKATFGAAIGNAGITVVVAGTSAFGVTDDSGTFVLHGVPAGTHDVVATAPGYATSTARAVVVEYEKEDGVPDLLLAHAAAYSGELSGKIIVTGESDASGVAVTATGATTAAAVSVVSGAWSMNGLPDGTYVVTAVAADTVEMSRTSKVDVVGGKATSLADFTFTPTGTLSGTVTLGAKTTGNAGTIVWTEGAPATFTDDTGAFSLHQVPTGDHTLRAGREGYAASSEAAPHVSWHASVTADAMALPLDPSSKTVIRGAALLPSATAHDGTTVSLTTSSGTWSGTTNVTGAYGFEALGSGTHTLSFLSKDGSYSHAIEDVLLMPGASAFTLRKSSLYPLPGIELGRGKLVGSGLPIGATAAGDAVFVDVGSTVKVYVASKTASSPSLLVDDSIADRTAQLSPDGAYLTYTATAHTMIVPTAGGISLPVGDFVGALRYTRDGARLVFVSYDGTAPSIRSRLLASGATTVLGLGKDFSLSPNGSWVAIDDPTSGATGGSVVSTAGGTPTKYDGRYAQWSADGERLITSVPSATSTGSTFRAYDLAGGTSHSLGTLTRLLALSPDGRWAVALDDASSPHVELFSLTTSASPVVLETLASCAGCSAGAVAAFSRDSTKLAYSLPTSSAVMTASTADPLGTLASIASSNATQLTFLEGGALVCQLSSGFVLVSPSGFATTLAPGLAWAPLVSPDGTKFAYVAGTSLRVTGSDGTTLVLSDIGFRALGWSADSKHLIASLDKSGLGWVSSFTVAGTAPPVALTATGVASFMPNGDILVSDFGVGTYYDAAKSAVTQGIWIASP